MFLASVGGDSFILPFSLWRLVLGIQDEISTNRNSDSPEFYDLDSLFLGNDRRAPISSPKVTQLKSQKMEFIESHYQLDLDFHQ